MGNEEAMAQMRANLSTFGKEKEVLTMRYIRLNNELETCQKEKKWAEDKLAASNVERNELTTSLKSTTVNLHQSGLYYALL
jgi:chromosome segregation ATPase